jgi:ABC-2 type transport system permease protein
MKSLYRNYIAYRTIVWSEVRRTFRIWTQTLLPPAITTTLYFVIFGHLMGQRIGTMSGLPYINFIVPGLIMMTMLMAAYNAAVFIMYMAKWTKTIEEILVSPMSAYTILLSFMSVGVARGMLVALVVGIIAELFTHIQIAHIFYMLLVMFLACSILSLLALINGLWARSFDQISIIPTFIITPLSYLGGVFYSLNVLPAFWQHVALFNPIVYLISSLRYSFFNIADTSILYDTIFMTVITLVLFFICAHLIRLRKGLAD